MLQKYLSLLAIFSFTLSIIFIYSYSPFLFMKQFRHSKKHFRLTGTTMLVIGIIILLLAILTYVGLYAYSISTVTIDNFEFIGVDTVSLSSISISGNFYISQKGIIPITLDYVTYQITLGNSSQIIATGKLSGGTITPRNVTTLPLSTTASWTPSFGLILEILQPGETTAIIQGEAQLHVFGSKSVTIPYSKEIPVENYLTDYAEQQFSAFTKKFGFG